VKGLQAKDLVIPVVGDLSGTTRARGHRPADDRAEADAVGVLRVERRVLPLRSAAPAFRAFIANLGKLPHDARSTIVRSVFTRGVADPGYNSASMTQSIEDLLSGYASGRYRQYGELISASR
jgi:hypothetical protein